MVSLQMKNMPQSEHLESYPPLFHQTNSPYASSHEHEEADEAATKHALIDSDPLPVIDFQCINREKEKEKLHEACANWGIFRLVNHGIPPILLEKLHVTSKQLFSYSFESKQSLFSSPMTYFWGTPALTNTGVPLKQGQSFNFMEGFNIPLNQLSLHHHAKDDDPLPNTFRSLLEEYGDHQSRLAGAIYNAMIQNLMVMSPKKSLYTDSCSLYLCPSTGFVRVYRYPATNKSSSWGMDVHTDSSLLTILNQDQVGGLQFYKDGEWHHVQPIPNTLILNLGDMLQAISDDKYKSVKHRVRANKHENRISVGYFVFPGDDVLIQSPSYKPFTYSDFRAQVQLDLKTLGYKVGLDRFRLPC